MRLPPFKFSSSLAAVLLMAAAGVQAGSIQIRSGSSTFFGGTTVTSGGKLVLTGNSATPTLQNLTISSGPLTAGDHTTASSVLPLQFPGAPLMGPAGLPFALSTVMSLLSQTGVLPTTGATSGTVLNASPNFPVAGAITTNSAALTKTGSGMLTLTSANSYTGAGVVTQGTLTVSNTGNVTAIGTGNLTSTQISNSGVAGTITVSSGTLNVANAGSLFASQLKFADGAQPKIILAGTGTLGFSIPMSVDETDPGTAFSESNPASLIDTEAGALFPPGTTVRVNGLANTVSGPVTATIVNQSATAKVIKRTSTGGMLFVPVGVATSVP